MGSSSIQTSNTWSYAPFYSANWSENLNPASATDVFTFTNTSATAIIEIHQITINGTCTTTASNVSIELFRRDANNTSGGVKVNSNYVRFDTTGQVSVLSAGDIACYTTAPTVNVVLPGRIGLRRVTWPTTALGSVAAPVVFDFNGNLPPIKLRPATAGTQLCIQLIGIGAQTSTMGLSVIWSERSGTY